MITRKRGFMLTFNYDTGRNKDNFPLPEASNEQGVFGG